jgi:hypothetical protein
MDAAVGDRPSGGAAPATLTVGGIPRRHLLVILSIAVALIAFAIAVGAWVTNVEPLVFDGGGYGMRPYSQVVHEEDATSPQGDSFTQFTLEVPKHGTFGYAFWLTNDSPFPVTVTGFGAGAGISWARIGPANGLETPGSTFPYTIPARAAATLEVRQRLLSCYEAGTEATIGTIPVTFKIFGIIERHQWVTLPMTIDIRSPAGTRCNS